MLPRQQKASLLFVLLCESVSENAKNEYSQISERTFPLGKFLNKPLGIVKVGNERDLVVWYGLFCAESRSIRLALPAFLLSGNITL